MSNRKNPPENLAAGISRAAELIRAGGIAAIPTETVYGLAADAANANAVAKIYAVKARPAFNPLIAHVNSAADAARHGVMSRQAERLAAAFWPGPLTLVMPFRESSPVCELARAGLSSIALRVPSDPVARAVIEASGVPLAAPSANLSGRISATSAADVRAELSGLADFVLDGGPSRIGVESTIISLLGSEPVCLRPGGLTREAIETVLGIPLRQIKGGKTVAPGMLASHYAPAAPLRLGASRPRSGELFLGFGPDQPEAALNLSANGNPTEAAANLYAMLRALDARSPAGIAVAPVPETGLGEAINDRLRRAAAPRVN